MPQGEAAHSRLFCLPGGVYAFGVRVIFSHGDT